MSSLTFFIFVLLLSSLQENALSCNQLDRDSLLSSFHNQISSSPPLNWSSSPDCCQWEGVACAANRINHNRRITRLSLPERSLSGAITPSFLSNLSFLTHLNLSHNQLSGPLSLPNLFRSLPRLQTLDFSFNRFSGLIQSSEQSSPVSPVSIRTLDLSSNHFNGSIKPLFLRNLIEFNVSNNSFTGPIPSSICLASPLLEILDFSINHFNGSVVRGFGECTHLRVLRAWFNSLSGPIPFDLYNIRSLKELSLANNRFSGIISKRIALLSNLTILELHVNELTGELPSEIGSLSGLEQLQLHTNSLNGTLPHSLMNCSNLTTLLLRNNHFAGEISILDFSKLPRLQGVDLGNNSFTGTIPDSLCLCRSITAVRLAYNQLIGEVPPCMASLRSLIHFSVSDNYLSNVHGALKILRHCENLAVIFMSRCFSDEVMPDDNELSGFKNLQILTLGGCKLSGEIPSWISRLTKIKVLNLSYNKISGRIPIWLGSMPSLFVLNLTQNSLSGELPREIGRLPALVSDNTSTDLSSLALPFLFDSLQYNRLFNLPRGLKVGNNSLSGNIPEEIGQLKLLHVLDLSNNNFDGSIPRNLSNLVNLERLDMSGNSLTGRIPESLTELHFLSYFSVADNDLDGEIPRGGQFDTFGGVAFEGNPKLCGYLLKRQCLVVGEVDEEEEDESLWSDDLPFGLGYLVGLVAVSITLWLCGFFRSK